MGTRVQMRREDLQSIGHALQTLEVNRVKIKNENLRSISRALQMLKGNIIKIKRKSLQSTIHALLMFCWIHSNCGPQHYLFFKG
jgi:hypothetical protein